MADEQYISVTDWELCQPYHDGRPMRWRKQWVNPSPKEAAVGKMMCLDNWDFTALPDLSRFHLQALHDLAVKLGNKIPYDSVRIQTEIKAEKPVDLDILIKGGWITVCGEPYETVRNRTESAASDVRVEKSRVDKKELCAEPEPQGTEPEDPVLLSYPIVRSKGNPDGDDQWHLRESTVKELYECFGERIALMPCMQSAKAWLVANQRKRKTWRGMLRFLTAWIESDINRGKGQAPVSWEQTIIVAGTDTLFSPANPHKPLTDADKDAKWDAARARQKANMEQAQATNKAYQEGLKK